MERSNGRYNGVLLLNKSLGITSHQAVVEVRQTIRQRRVGHTGTLDPNAAGLVVVCIGRATKIVQFVSDFDKTYEAEICLGRRSTTYDSEGILSSEMPKDPPDVGESYLEEVLEEFTGCIEQRVPAYSAVRLNGKRLYDLARAGQEVELPIRKVNIKSIEILKYEKPFLSILVSCSKGTYIRSLANDIGDRLQCGAYLSNLKRTRVGNLDLSDAFEINDVRQHHEEGKLRNKLLSFEDVLNFSGILVTDDFKPRVISGSELRATDIAGTEGDFSVGDRVLLKDKSGAALAIGTAELNSADLNEADGAKIFSYTRVLN